MARPIYERYLSREVAAGSLVVLAAFLGLFGFFDLVNELEDVGRGTYTLSKAIGYVLLTLPGRAYELLPIAVLIGGLLALVTMARHSEIVVLRTSGLATAGMLASLAKIGLVFVALIFLVGEFVAPPAEQYAQQLRRTAIGDTVDQEFRTGFWVRDEMRFVNVRKVLPDASLKDVRIFEFDAERKLKSISQAQSGRYLAGHGWQLSEVKRTAFGDGKAVVESLPELVWQSTLGADIVDVLLLDPERMSIISLYRYIEHLRENKQKTQRYDIAFWKKLLYPFAAVVMLALALPFAYQHNRMSPVSLKVFLGVMLGVFFHMLNGLFSNLGQINSWQPLIAAATPSVMFLMLAAAMLWWTERR